MYCPLCGSEMQEVERKFKVIEEPEWGNKEAEDKYFEATSSKNEDNSWWWYCPINKCFGKDYPLVQHHAPGFKFDEGKDLMKTHPGDSWSLTWLK